MTKRKRALIITSIILGVLILLMAGIFINHKIRLNSEKELQISTIDSFFMQLVKVYAPELGIWGEINMIDQQDSRLLRRTFRQWVRSITDPAKLELLRELLYYGVSSISLSTTGSQQQGVRACTSRMRDDLYDVMEERMRAFRADH